jgi:Holliday junction resolvasome RuvABC endonuclease subunit
MILGLDISTTCIGIMILDLQGKIILSDKIEYKQKDLDLFDKVVITKVRLKELELNYDITEIWIEEVLLGFGGGKTNANTMAVLIAFNRMVAYQCWEIFGFKCHEVPSTTARKAVIGVGRANKKKGEDIKKLALAWVVKNYPDFIVELNRNGVPNITTYDRSDSMVIAKYGLLKNRS